MKYLLTIIFTGLFIIPVYAAVDHLLISEVHYDPSEVSDTLGEWVELYNPLSYTVELSTYILSDNFGSFSLSGRIAAGSYFMVGKDNATFSGLYGFDLDVSGMDLALANSGDKLSLIDNSQEVDFVAWRGYESGWYIDAKSGQSIMRGYLDIDTDTVDDWVGRAVPSPTESSLIIPEPATLAMFILGLLQIFLKPAINRI